MPPRDSVTLFEYGIRSSDTVAPGTFVAIDRDSAGANKVLGQPTFLGPRYVVMANPVDIARPDFRWKALDVIVAYMRHHAEVANSHGVAVATHLVDDGLESRMSAPPRYSGDLPFTLEPSDGP